jgi:hypothetical protein
MNVTVIENPPTHIHEDDSSGLLYLDEKYRDADKHPEIMKCRPVSPYGSAYLSKFDNSDYFAWVKPVSGGVYRSCNPVFLIDA